MSSDAEIVKAEGSANFQPNATALLVLAAMFV